MFPSSIVLSIYDSLHRLLRQYHRRTFLDAEPPLKVTMARLLHRQLTTPQVDRQARMRTMTKMETILLPASQVVLLVDQLSAVYRAAFGGPPYYRKSREVDEFARALPLLTQRPGFRCAAALDAGSGEITGFAYGYRSLPGQWWYDHVARAMGSEMAAEWLSDAFQVAELAMRPEHQGRGAGGALHDLLLAGVTQSRAVLSTMAVETAAHTLYRHRGWQVVLDRFLFPGVPRSYAIMGLDIRASKEKGIS